MAKAEKPDGRRSNGRPNGSSNKRTEEAFKKAKKGGILPLDFLLKQMRNHKLDLAVRMTAAKDAAPYVHNRLQATTVKGDVNITHEQALKELLA